MDLEWMGRYRPLVAALVQHTNVISKAMGEKENIGDGVFLNPNEWQTFEYIVEHRENTFSMIDISRCLGIPQSSFSKIVKTLQKFGLVEKYTTDRNRKSIILRPTDKAVDIYEKRTETTTKERFEDFFSELESITDDEIIVFTKALEHLTEKLQSVSHDKHEIRLIKK